MADFWPVCFLADSLLADVFAIMVEVDFFVAEESTFANSLLFHERERETLPEMDTPPASNASSPPAQNPKRAARFSVSFGLTDSQVESAGNDGRVE